MVRSLVSDGLEVFIQSQAGQRSVYTDDMYLVAGAKIVSTAAEIYACDMVVKVKEPQSSEISLIREGLVSSASSTSLQSHNLHKNSWLANA